jgi:FixH
MKYIAIALGIFVIIMVWMGYEMVFSTNETPQENYYEQALGYDKYQQAKQNVASLAEKPIISYDNGKYILGIKLSAEVQNLEGSLQILKVSDQSQDLHFKLSAANQQQFVLPANLKGLCNLILAWKSNGKDFLYEEKIVF